MPGIHLHARCLAQVDRERVAFVVPVVFLILPVTILFAVFPGFTFFRFTL